MASRVKWTGDRKPGYKHEVKEKTRMRRVDRTKREENFEGYGEVNETNRRENFERYNGNTFSDFKKAMYVWWRYCSSVRFQRSE